VQSAVITSAAVLPDENVPVEEGVAVTLASTYLTTITYFTTSPILKTMWYSPTAGHPTVAETAVTAAPEVIASAA